MSEAVMQDARDFAETCEEIKRKYGLDEAAFRSMRIADVQDARDFIETCEEMIRRLGLDEAVMREIGIDKAALRELGMSENAARDWMFYFVSPPTPETDEEMLREWKEDKELAPNAELDEEMLREWEDYREFRRDCEMAQAARRELEEDLRNTLRARRNDAAMGEAERRKLVGFLQSSIPHICDRATMADPAEWDIARVPPKQWKGHLGSLLRHPTREREIVARQMHTFADSFELATSFVQECFDAPKNGKNLLTAFLNFHSSKMYFDLPGSYEANLAYLVDLWTSSTQGAQEASPGL